MVKAFVAIHLALCYIHTLVFAQHSHVKASARHLHHLVHQHISGGPNFAFEAQTAAQQEGLAISAAIGELGEVQVNADHTVKLEYARVFGIGKLQDFWVSSPCGMCASSY